MTRKAYLTHKVQEGSERISCEEARELWELFSFPELATLAQRVRWRHNPTNTVTYLIDRNINYTNVCNSDCSFCAFYRHNPRDPESYVLSRETIAQKVKEAKALGATRLLLQGGHNDELP